MGMKKILRRVRDWQICCIIAFVGIAVYGKSIVYDYTFSDDTQLLVVNQEFLGNPANLPKLFTTDVFISMANPNIFYRPLLNLLFMLEMQVSKDTPVLYHITNILLHLGCSVLVFILFRKLNLSKLLSAAASLLFCVHPLLSSAVVWIPGRNDTLLTIFVLGSFIFFLRALETKRAGPFLWHVLLLFFALLTKETAVVAPVLFLSYAYFIGRKKFRRTQVFSALFIYAFVVGAWLFLRSLVTLPFEVRRTLGSQIASWLGNTPAFILYFGKIFFPFNLSIFPNLADQSLLLGWLSIALFIGALFIRKPKSFGHILWGLGWFFLFLAPTMIIGPIFHEHRAYCSMVGVLLAVACLPLVQSIDFSGKTPALCLAAIVVAFGVVTMIHEEQYNGRAAYVTSAFASAPGVDESYSGLAGLLMDEGNDGAAEKVLRAGIERKPAMKIVHRMLGDVYSRRHQYALAAKEYETSLRLEPLHLYTYINYGKMCLNDGRVDDAARLWKTSVLVDPDFLLGYYYLANCYIHCKNDPDSAMIYVRQLQKRGVAVLPELLRAIENHPPKKNRHR
jgi:tetratricopeptide (TPR) repeat protein